MSSSRSIAAARARRAGEQAPPPPSRPGQSINSHAAFAPPQQNVQGRNVRVAQAPIAPQTQQYSQPTTEPRLTKLSVSDAIGLITLRLGRVESILIEMEHNKEMNGSSSNNGEGASASYDKTLIANIVARLDSLEKSLKDTVQVKEVASIKDAVSTLTIKQLSIENRQAQMEKDVSDRFSDYEVALSEIEKQLPMPDEIVLDENIQNQTTTASEEPIENEVLSTDLKNLVKMELSGENSA